MGTRTLRAAPSGVGAMAAVGSGAGGASAATASVGASIGAGSTGCCSASVMGSVGVGAPASATGEGDATSGVAVGVGSGIGASLVAVSGSAAASPALGAMRGPKSPRGTLGCATAKSRGELEVAVGVVVDVALGKGARVGVGGTRVGVAVGAGVACSGMAVGVGASSWLPAICTAVRLDASKSKGSSISTARCKRRCKR